MNEYKCAELPNGVRIFNATPHSITFFQEDWPGPVEVPASGKTISARVEERVTEVRFAKKSESTQSFELVNTTFIGTKQGAEIAHQALEEGGADVVIGSIIAAQAYPGLVVGMTPAPGYERVAPAEKRMNPDKFVVF